MAEWAARHAFSQSDLICSQPAMSTASAPPTDKSLPPAPRMTVAAIAATLGWTGYILADQWLAMSPQSLAGLSASLLVAIALGGLLGLLSGATLGWLLPAGLAFPRFESLLAAMTAVWLGGWGWALAAHESALELHGPLVPVFLAALALAIAIVALIGFWLVRRVLHPLRWLWLRGPVAERLVVVVSPVLVTTWSVTAVGFEQSGRGASGPSLIALSIGVAIALASCWLCARGNWLPRWRWMPAIGATAICLAILASPLVDRNSVQRGTVVPTMSQAAVPLLDFDGDGQLSFLGGGDCAGFDGTRSALAVEIVANGVDEDCQFGDMRPRPRPATPTARVARIVLLTVSALPATDRQTLARVLPRLDAALERGVRFSNHAGVEGTHSSIASILLSGRPPYRAQRPSSGLMASFPSLARELQLDSQSHVIVDHTPGVTQNDIALFGARGVKRPSRKRLPPTWLVSTGARALKRPRAFVWLSLHHRSNAPNESDEAVGKLLTTLDALGDYALIAVALAPDRVPPEPELTATSRGFGGPLGVIGSAIGARVSERFVDLFDVHPTVLGLAGVTAEQLPESPESPGRSDYVGTSLLGDAPRSVALTGWLGTRAGLAAISPRGVLVYEHDGRGFRWVTATWPRSFSDDASPTAASKEIDRLRAHLLAPTLQARNRAIAAALVSSLPAGMTDSVAVFGAALEVLGCEASQPDKHTLWLSVLLRGGENLRPDDQFRLKIRSQRFGPIYVQGRPLSGAYPFGTWRKGEVIRHRVAVDITGYVPGPSDIWAAVVRDGERLPITSGEGPSNRYVWICSPELLERS